MVGVAIIKLLVKRKKKQPEMWFRRNCAIAKEGAAYPSPHKKTFAEFQKNQPRSTVVVQVVLALNRRRSLFFTTLHSAAAAAHWTVYGRSTLLFSIFQTGSKQ